jgi:hypothetical protein
MRSFDPVRWAFTLAAPAYNLICPPRGDAMMLPRPSHSLDRAVASAASVFGQPLPERQRRRAIIAAAPHSQCCSSWTHLAEAVVVLVRELATRG